MDALDRIENKLYQKYVKEGQYPIYEGNEFIGHFTLNDFLQEEFEDYTPDQMNSEPIQQAIVFSWYSELYEAAMNHALMCSQGITH